MAQRLKIDLALAVILISLSGIAVHPCFAQNQLHQENQRHQERDLGLLDWPDTATLRRPDVGTLARVREAYGKFPLTFEVNQGQAGAEVKFLSRGSSYSLFLNRTEAVLNLVSCPTLGRRQAPGVEGQVSDVRKILSTSLTDQPSLTAATRSLIPIPGPPTSDARPLTLRMKLVGAKPSSEITGMDELPGRVNYFIGNDSKQWRTNIPTYSRVKYRDVYPGIDLIYYGKQHELEYDFVVAPGADPGTITLGFDGSAGAMHRSFLEIDASGDLLLNTTHGQIRQLKPRIYQYLDGIRKEVSGNYLIKGKDQIGFQVSSYDRDKPLVIDPVLEYFGSVSAKDGPVYSTFLGGSGEDLANGIAVDSAGNAYVTGYTRSINLPLVGGTQSGNGGGFDVFITKLNPAASAMVYSTYLGGSGTDAANGIAVDATGNAYIVGRTSSANFPTVNPFQRTLATAGGGVSRTIDGGQSWADINVGLTDTIIYALAVDPVNTSTLYAGTARSGIFKTTNGGGKWSQINTGLTRLSFYSLGVDPTNPSNVYAGSFNGFVYRSVNGGSDWIGSSVGPNVQIFALAIDPSNSATLYAATFGGGIFKSSNSGVTWTTVNTGLASSFVLALAINPRNPSILYAGAFGGIFRSTDGGNNWSAIRTGLPDTVFVFSIAVNPTSPTVLYLGTFGDGVFKSIDSGGSWSRVNTGLTNRFVYALTIDPTTPSILYAGTDDGIFKSANSGNNWTATNSGLSTVVVEALVIDPANPSKLYVSTISSSTDVFVAKLNPSGSALVFSTYLGGGRRDFGIGITVDSTGNVYVTGYTDSLDFPTANAVQATNGGGFDVFVTKFNPAGSGLIYSTYLGGSGSDFGFGIAVDSGGNAHVTGSTDSTNFPTANPLQPANGGALDVFVAKIGSTGSALLYSTYLGGTKDDVGAAIAVDTGGNAYLTGSTASTRFPTANALQPTNLGNFDAFVTKLNPAGSSLIYSTYLGGSSGDFGFGIAVDSTGNAYVVGDTDSTNFPTKNPIQPMKGGGVFKSNNGGSAWNISNNGLSSPGISSLVLDPGSPSTIYAGTFGGIFKSTDGGGSWNAVNNGLTSTSVSSLAIDPAIPSTIYAGAAGGIYKSTNAGVSWTAINAGLTNITISVLAIDPTNTSTIYAGAFGGGVFKSTNGGDFWSAINTGLTNLNILSLAAARTTPSTLYAGTLGNGLFKSVDGGANWTATGLIETVLNIVAVDNVTPTTIYVGTEQGIFKSINSGGAFSVFNTGLTNTLTSSLAIDPTNSSIIYAGTFSGIFKSTNGGINWSATGLISDFSLPSSVVIDPKSPSTLYAGISGGAEVFAAKLNSAGSTLAYSTYLGGMGRDRSFGIAVDSFGNAYVTGDTTSTNFPTVAPLQSIYGGGAGDAFVTKIPAVLGPLCTLSCTATVPASEKAGARISFSATATASDCSGTPTYEWNFGDGTPVSTQQDSIHSYSGAGTYTWTMTVKVGDASPCTKTGTIQVLGDPPRRRP